MCRMRKGEKVEVRLYSVSKRREKERWRKGTVCVCVLYEKETRE